MAKEKKPLNPIHCQQCKFDEKGKVKTYYFARAGNRPIQLCYQCFMKVNEEHMREFARIGDM